MAIRKKSTFPADAVVECIESHAIQLPDSPAAVFVAGTRLRADHPVVAANPHLWALVGTPHDEIQQQLRDNHAVEPQPEPDPVRITLEKRLLDRDAVVPVRDLVGALPGTRLHKNDDLVKRNKDAFVPVVGPGRTAANSYVARSTLRHVRADDTVVTVHAGTYVARDHELVKLHPHQFALPHPEQSDAAA